MAFDGNGFFQFPSPAYPFIPQTVITAESMNEVLAEVQSALSIMLGRNGSLKPTADIPWGSFRLRDLGNGSADGDAVNFKQVFQNPIFTNPKAQASPIANASGLELVTAEWVRLLSLNVSLPNQSVATTGFALTSNGTVAGWTSLDSRGIKYLVKGNSGTNPVNFDFMEAEAHALTITGATTISFSGWPNDRVAVRLLTLTNAGLFPPTFSGVLWIGLNGQETANFADAGVTWQNNGRDRIIILKEPGLSPVCKVIR